MSLFLKTREELIQEWSVAIERGTFITEKHSPNSEYNPEKSNFRTIYTPPASESIATFVKSGEYDIFRYEDYGREGNAKKAKAYFVLKPNAHITFGLPSGSVDYPNADYKFLTVVSGSDSGFHGIPECEEKLHERQVSGSLKNESIVS